MGLACEICAMWQSGWGASPWSVSKHADLVALPFLQVICKPGAIKTATQFEAEIYALTKEEGGRHTPFTSKYMPQFFFRTADINGEWMRAYVTCL